mmetsp:Transcript_54501/g.116428  ORF Transcript_54501/g.116428 Transcript_54501/m.116428 type:complete len:451 (+) Transcript_54501:2165-3517(+)
MAVVQIGEAGATHAADGLDLALEIARQGPAGVVQGQTEVQSVVDAPQNAQVAFKVADEAAPVGVDHVRLCGDGPAVGGEALLVDAVIGEHLPVLPHVAIGLQILDDGPADADIFWGGVVVQFLMPLFVVGAMDLLDVVGVHDDENLVSDLLASGATTTHGCKSPSDPHTATRMGLPQLGHSARDLIGGASQHPGLCAGVALPGQEPLEGESLPYEDPAPKALLAGLDVLFLQFEHGHRRQAAPDRGAGVDVHQCIPGVKFPHVHALALLLPAIDELQAVLVAALERHLVPGDFLLNNLLRDLRPFTPPAAQGGKASCSISATSGFEPLTARGIFEHKADASDRRLNHDFSVFLLLLLSWHGELKALQVAWPGLQLNLACLVVDPGETLRPGDCLGVDRRAPLRGACPFQDTKVQDAVAKPGMEPAHEFHLGQASIVIGGADNIDFAAIPL